MRLLVALVVVAACTVAAHPPSSAASGPGEAAVTRVVVGTTDVGSLAGTPGVVGVEPMEHLPFAVVEATAGAVARLRASGSVTSLEADLPVAPALADALPLDGAPAVWSAGPRGEGRTVGFVDTGIEAGDPALAGRVVGEACFVRRSAGGGGCPGGGTARVGPGAAATCRTSACRHGTAVAIAAAGDGATDSVGVAPGASLYAVQVFDFVSPGCAAGCAGYGDVVAALDHLAGVADTVDLAAVNLSVTIGTTRHTGPCDAQLPALRTAVRAIRDLGVSVVAPSGNLDLSKVPSTTSGMAAPACIEDVVAVGATAGSSRVASFSQLARGLDLLAPGQGLDIRTASGGTTRLSGTSLAAAQVSGGLVLAADLLPGRSLAARERAVEVMGVPVTDTRPRGPDLVTPRLRLRVPVAMPGVRVVPGGAPTSGQGLAGDLDGDGRDDLLEPAGGRLAYGRGDRGFDLVDVAPLPAGTRLVGNFVGSPGGPDDVYVLAPPGGTDGLWMGRQERTLRALPQRRAIARPAVVGDFDGDGLDDLLWSASGGVPGAVWTGGATGFTKRRVDLVPGPSLVGDVDGDGADDLLVFRAAGVVELRPGDPDLLFEGYASGLEALPLALGDLDGDGDLDAVLAGAPLRVQHFADGAFEAPQDLPGGVTGSVATTADLDGDGRAEVVVGGGATATILRVAGASTGASSVLTGGQPVPARADLDGDGRDEVLWRAVGRGAEVWWSWP